MVTILFFGAAGIMITLVCMPYLGQQTAQEIILAVGVICFVFVILARRSLRDEENVYEQR